MSELHLLPESVQKRLVEIAKEHTGLAREFGEVRDCERKKEILRKIEVLRMERRGLMGE
ncbi:MAG: hypothetical protein JG764_983 [Clostridiales bacterium]|nr:hypothetical protein [Clostridiales bacterium]